MHLTGANPDRTADGTVRILVDEEHAYPCRCCLTDAEPGEAVLLVSHDPWRVPSPYRRSGPVFVHEVECARCVDDRLPDQQVRRVLSLRGFDGAGLPTVADVIDGASAERRLEDALHDGRTDFVHLHYAGPGCFAVRVDR